MGYDLKITMEWILFFKKRCLLWIITFIILHRFQIYLFCSTHSLNYVWNTSLKLPSNSLLLWVWWLPGWQITFLSVLTSVWDVARECAVFEEWYLPCINLSLGTRVWCPLHSVCFWDIVAVISPAHLLSLFTMEIIHLTFQSHLL